MLEIVRVLKIRETIWESNLWLCSLWGASAGRSGELANIGPQSGSQQGRPARARRVVVMENCDINLSSLQTMSSETPKRQLRGDRVSAAADIWG